jgi:hypothetical protein
MGKAKFEQDGELFDAQGECLTKRPEVDQAPPEASKPKTKTISETIEDFRVRISPRTTIDTLYKKKEVLKAIEITVEKYGDLVDAAEKMRDMAGQTIEAEIKLRSNSEGAKSAAAEKTGAAPDKEASEAPKNQGDPGNNK